MRINELLSENEHLDEFSLAGAGAGVGNVIRKTSSAVQGAKGAWQGAKDAWSQGKQSGTYDAARSAVAGTPPASTAGPATPPSSISATSGGASRPYVNTGVSDISAPASAPKGGVSGIMQAINKLDPASKKQLAGELQKSISRTPVAIPAA